MKLKSVNPFSGEVTAEFDELSDDAVLQAVVRAREEFGKWRKVSVANRLKPVAKMASILRQNKAEYARIFAVEMGKPIREGAGEVEKCAQLCDYYYENTEAFLKSEIVETDAKKSCVVFDPLGVTLGIMPWNFPFWQVARWAVPSLAVGNVCLLKHASNVPMTAIKLGEIFAEAGFPKNAFQTLLIGSKKAERLIEQDLVDSVSLTGSVMAGMKVGEIAGKQLKKAVFELGGSDPFIVLDDADVEGAAKAAIVSRMGNAGQTCIAAKRLIVMESVAKAFTAKLVEEMNVYKVGDPLDEKTDMGPLAKKEFVGDLEKQFDDALKKGATVHYGQKPPNHGFFFRPAVLTGLTKDMLVVKEEVFGPVACVIEVKSEEEAIQIANDTEFGLGAAIWSKDIAKAEKLAREIDAGYVAVNRFVKSDSRLPFGGVKKSGHGRELSYYGLKELANIKTIAIDP